MSVSMVCQATGSVLFGATEAARPGATEAAQPGASLLPEPGDAFAMLDTGDVGAALAKLALENGYESRKAGRAAREVAEKAQEAAEQKQLEERRAQADSAFVGGLVGGFSTVASGGFAFAAGGAQANTSVAEGVALGTAKRFEAGGKLLEGTGTVGKAVADHSASAHDVATTEAEQAASREKRNVDDAKEIVDDAKKLIDRTLDFYREYQTGKADAQRAAIMRA